MLGEGLISTCAGGQCTYAQLWEQCSLACQEVQLDYAPHVAQAMEFFEADTSQLWDAAEAVPAAAAIYRTVYAMVTDCSKKHSSKAKKEEESYSWWKKIRHEVSELRADVYCFAGVNTTLKKQICDLNTILCENLQENADLRRLMEKLSDTSNLLQKQITVVEKKIDKMTKLQVELKEQVVDITQNSKKVLESINEAISQVMLLLILIKYRQMTFLNKLRTDTRRC